MYMYTCIHLWICNHIGLGECKKISLCGTLKKNAISSKYACKFSLNRKFRTSGSIYFTHFTAIVTKIVFVYKKYKFCFFLFLISLCTFSFFYRYTSKQYCVIMIPSCENAISSDQLSCFPRFQGLTQVLNHLKPAWTFEFNIFQSANGLYFCIITSDQSDVVMIMHLLHLHTFNLPILTFNSNTPFTFTKLQ